MNSEVKDKSSSGRLAAVFSLSLLTAWLIIGGCRSKLEFEGILDFDYQHEECVRVLIEDDLTSCQIKVENLSKVFADNSQIEFDGTVFNIESDRSKIQINGKTINSNTIVIEPRCPAISSVNGRKYRGKVSITLKGDELQIINTLPIETYLAGVVAAEMPAQWDSEALKSQTVSARTYCVYIRDRFGKNRSWDLKASQANQVYKGLIAEHPRIWSAINETYGLVLTCEESEHPKKIFPTYYCSVCGGHTENSKYVFGDSYLPLAGVECPYCKKVTSKKFFEWGPKEYSKEVVFNKLCQYYPQLKSKLGSLKTLEAVRKSEYNDFKRITRYKLIGENGKSDIVGGEDLRLSLDSTGRKLRSACCDIKDKDHSIVFKNGRGFGHGVGLCQYGVLAMAKEGSDYRAILSFYFPSSELKRIY